MYSDRPWKAETHGLIKQALRVVGSQSTAIRCPNARGGTYQCRRSCFNGRLSTGKSLLWEVYIVGVTGGW
eukprot:scaffold201263_cov20-Prasinocladus_malaysianus.AAC.1